jgi:hypothetical protein
MSLSILSASSLAQKHKRRHIVPLLGLSLECFKRSPDVVECRFRLQWTGAKCFNQSVYAKLFITPEHFRQPVRVRKQPPALF